MSTVEIRGIPVSFPFEPYSIQKDYMEKVIQCLQDGSNGILESPTGTGKTLSLLCASLAWLEYKKAQVQSQRLFFPEETFDAHRSETGAPDQPNIYGLPNIIYASRTHSQLSQAMQELKRTKYSYMKATVLGSRDQMCIHPEISKEDRISKNHLCQLKVKTRSCHFYKRVEQKKIDPAICNGGILDIEDLVKVGQQQGFCPFYMTKELKQCADIVFTPYNYLLDPRTRKGIGLELQNSVIILDEAHNVETVCESSASLDIKSTDITLCIEEVTEVMKAMSDELPIEDGPTDFSPQELCMLKQMLLDFEKAVDAIQLQKPPNLTVFDGDYMFDILEKAGICDENGQSVIGLLDRIVQFLSVSKDGPFARRGNGLQLFHDLLVIVFAKPVVDYREKIKKCFKVHISIEEAYKKTGNDWLSKATKKECRVLNYWCFSPGFGMSALLAKEAKCIIFTSGTLAPLGPLISELEINVPVTLENPHVIGDNQVFVQILTKGPDGEPLNCSYANRDNPMYVYSLGRAILNLTRIIPDGLLVFFASYTIMQKCHQAWQEDGTWSNICEHKTIYVEPKGKESFTNIMNEYYEKIRNPQSKGAIFMGVFRGKVAEGLDFIDANGRAVIITGLPYPPLKDPRVILKKRYLDSGSRKGEITLKGDQWYSLEATRAVNQAIGRVIRHRHDYGAILFLDSRFDNPRIKSNLSKWLSNKIKVANEFGQIIGGVRRFFKNAEATLPKPTLRPQRAEPQAIISNPTTNIKTQAGNFDFSTSQASGSSTFINANSVVHSGKRKRVTLISKPPSKEPTWEDAQSYMIMLKNKLPTADYATFKTAIGAYVQRRDFEEFLGYLDTIFTEKPALRYLIQGMESYVFPEDKEQFSSYWERMKC